MTRRSAGILALRVVLSVGLLAVAFLMIEFKDRTVYHLKSGRTVTSEDGSFSSSDVVRREDRPGLITVARRVKPWPAVLAIPLLLLLYTTQALRWRLLLAANGFTVAFGRVLRITWAGVFFNQVLPGSVGGDVAKALIVAKGEERKAGVFGTVILDRIVGLATVLIIAAAAIVPVVDREELKPVVWLIVALLGGGAFGSMLYFNPAIRGWGPARRLKERLPFLGAVKEVDGVLKTMHHAPRTILAAVGLSAAGQVSTILAIYALAVSLGGHAVPLSDFFLFEPIIFLVTALPISVGGWGVEQVAYAQLFGMAGMAATTAIALSVLYKLTVLAVSLPGGVLFAAGATRGAPRPEPVQVPD